MKKEYCLEKMFHFTLYFDCFDHWEHSEPSPAKTIDQEVFSEYKNAYRWKQRPPSKFNPTKSIFLKVQKWEEKRQYPQNTIMGGLQ